MQLKKSEEENKKILIENKQLNVQVTEMRAEIKKMTINKQKKAEAIVVNVLQKVFTSGQIKMLMSSKKSNIKWSPEDIISAISLRSVSPKAYRYLREVMNVPLPCTTTLQNWVTKFKVSPGILKDVINIMSSKGAAYQQQKN